MKNPEGQLNQDNIGEYKVTLNKVTEIRKEVASNLRHIYTGNRAWSLDWKEAQNRKHLWWLILKRKKIFNREIKGKQKLGG